jgi:hypothetical protein
MPDEGVNFTAGLPVVRTSPAHGTAYALAGNNEASESSFRSALYLACDILRIVSVISKITAIHSKNNILYIRAICLDLPVQDEE